LRKTLEKIKNQTHQPDQVILIDDNSIDETANIAKEFGCEVYAFPQQHENWVTHYNLAKVFNLGFRFLHDDLDYIMIVGADHILPNDYIETMINRMESRPKLVVASGKIDNEWIVSPRGSGRLIKSFFWKKMNKVYPINWGYESYILYKALQLGYEIDVFADVHTQTQRPTAFTYKPIMFFHYGKAMKALGYSNWYGFGRCLVIAKRKGIKSAVQMFKGFKSGGVLKYEKELRDNVRENHRKQVQHFKRFFSYLTNKE